MTVPVVVIGDAVIDVRAAPTSPIRIGSDGPAEVLLLPGGQGANVAVRLARRGVGVEIITALADDVAGRVLRRSLEADGVRVQATELDATGAVVVIAEANGERTMLSRRSPFGHILDVSEISASEWTIVSGYVLTEPTARALCESLARREGRRVLVGCAVPDDRVDEWRAAAIALRPDLIVLNRDEARRLGPRAGQGVAVTDAGGATVTIAGVTVASVTSTVTPALDTTGAGDAFTAALVAELASAAWPPARDVIQDALEAAVALASRVSQVVGAQGRVADERPARLPA